MDAERSHVGFKVRKMGLYYVKGRFEEAEGRLELGPDGLPTAGRLVVQAGSVTTRMPPRDLHLRSRDFFDAKRFPILEIDMTAIDAFDEDGFVVTARASIHGVERPLRLAAHVHDEPKGHAIHLRGTLDRHDHAIRPRAPFEWIVGREVLLDVTLALTPGG